MFIGYCCERAYERNIVYYLGQFVCAYEIQYSCENEYLYEKVLLKVAQNVITKKKYTFLHGNWIVTVISLSYLVFKKACIFVLHIYREVYHQRIFP